MMQPFESTPESNDETEEWNGEDLESSVSSGNLIWPIVLSLMVLFNIGLIYYEPGSFGDMAQNLNPMILLAAIVLLALRVVLGAWRLNFVSHGQLGYHKAFRGQLLWDFASSVTPSLIGGGPLAAIVISKDARMRLGDITSVILFSMLLDQIWFAGAVLALLVASMGINVFPDSLGWVGSTVFIAFFFGILSWTLVFGYATLVNPGILRSIVHGITSMPFLRRYREWADKEMDGLRDRAALLRSQSPIFFLKGLLLTLLIWLSRYFSLLFIVWSVHATLPKVSFFFRTVAMMTGALIMPTPGGSGGIEGMYALFFNTLMPQPFVAPTLLFWRSLAYYLFVAIGVYLSTQIVRGALRERR